MQWIYLQSFAVFEDCCLCFALYFCFLQALLGSIWPYRQLTILLARHIPSWSSPVGYWSPMLLVSVISIFRMIIYHFFGLGSGCLVTMALTLNIDLWQVVRYPFLIKEIKGMIDTFPSPLVHVTFLYLVIFLWFTPGLWLELSTYKYASRRWVS